MKITNEQIQNYIRWFKLFQTPNRFPSTEDVVDSFSEIWADEIARKKKPFDRTLSKTCMTCVRFCVMETIAQLQKLGIINERYEQSTK